MNKILLFLTISLLGLTVQAQDLSSSEVDKYLSQHPEIVQKHFDEKQKEIFKKIGLAAREIESPQYIQKYLDEHPTFLEKYLEANPEMIRNIMIKKMQEDNERAIKTLEAAVELKKLEATNNEGDKMIAELEDSGMINPRYTKQLKEAIEKKKNRFEEPLTMDCSDGIKITTNDVDNVRVNSCALGYCNGRTFCKSKSELKNQNAAVEWCRSYDGKLVEFDHLCPRPENDRGSVGGVCSNLAGILKNELLWTNTPEHKSSSYYVFINSEGVPYFSAGRRDQKGYAVCENATMNEETTSNKTEISKQNPSEYVLGNPNGTFVIKAIYDYQCGWCKKSHAALQKMLQSEKAKNIKIVLMPNPIFGEVSEMMAQYVLAAANQGKLEEMHHAVFTIQGQRNEDAVLDIAKGLGLDIEQLKKDAQGSAVKDALNKTKRMVNDLRISGVPAFIINGKIKPGAILDEKAEEILKMQEDFVPDVLPEFPKINEEKNEIVLEPKVLKAKAAVKDETNLTASPEATKIFESISEDENPLSLMLKLRKAMEKQVDHNMKEIVDNTSDVVKEFDFDGYYKNYTQKAIDRTQKNYSDKEVKKVKKLMKKKETKRALLLLVSTCFSVHKGEEEQSECIENLSNQSLEKLDEQLKDNSLY